MPVVFASISLVFSPFILMFSSSPFEFSPEMYSTPFALNSLMIDFHALISLSLSPSVYFLCSLFVVMIEYISLFSSDSGSFMSFGFLITHGISVSSFQSSTFSSAISRSIAVSLLSPPNNM